MMALPTTARIQSLRRSATVDKCVLGVNPVVVAGVSCRRLQRCTGSRQPVKSLNVVAPHTASWTPSQQDVLTPQQVIETHKFESDSRAVGVILGAMAGNALGVPVQHERHWQVTRMFPDGLTEFFKHDLSAEPVPAGHVTGEFELLMAVALSLAAARVCEVTQIAKSLADNCDMSARRYVNPHTRYLLGELQQNGAPLHSIHFLSELPVMAAAYHATATAQTANSFSDRPDREPWGTADNSAAACVAPLAIAYQTAPWPVLDAAVQELCMLSHSHPIGLDGARVMAASLHWLLNNPQPEPDSNEEALQLLEYLSTVAQTDDMRNKLALLQQNLIQIGKVKNWSELYKTQSWHQLTNTLSRITYHDYATSGTEATSVALLALLTSWGRPQQAVSVAAAFAGSAPVTTQMVGALAGAANGDSWIPASWKDQLENTPTVTEHAHTPGLKDRAVAVAKQLACLRCSTVGLNSVLPEHQ